MKQLDIALANLADTLKAARQIAFLLAGFSIASIYWCAAGRPSQSFLSQNRKSRRMCAQQW
jgi:hypothetical protein